MWLKLLQWLALVQVFQVIAVPSELLGKIFGGKTSPVADYGFMVNLRRRGMFRCGGTLISSSCVLTAAHCLENRHEHVDDLFVHAQQQCLGDSSSAAHVRQAWYAWVSPHYCPQCNLDSDIAVIKLRQPFDIAGNATILPIDYNELPDSANLTVMGWGNTRNQYEPNWNQCLQTAKVNLVPQRECAQIMSSFAEITPNMLCALGPNATDACQGDSGGPIVYNGRTVGIVSWGFGCGSGYPGVYTRLSSTSMTWFLKSFVEQHC
ncbi:chymotrypsin-1 [Drosophila grimshawi]|uniref:trypsin n=1 Tax=Drosophila grimshawi TaxID=7222 RepID=B4IX51_DROGR|nr:chymotrypsin-1 [Drosophila grimshawi]EDV96357.1 GH15248 [Drosophila grimshawi]